LGKTNLFLDSSGLIIAEIELTDRYLDANISIELCEEVFSSASISLFLRLGPPSIYILAALASSPSASASVSECSSYGSSSSYAAICSRATFSLRPMI
jgi:hypothetical protein